VIGARLGPYEITAKLGEGGMGQVFQAKDFHLGRNVALKVLPEGFTQDAERLARFEREAKLLAQLNHPNIAQIHGLEIQGETRALVMELVEGPTLAERLEQGPLPFNESLSVSLQIAHALEEAHEKGIVHRDLKPQNIKASMEGKVKVLDFGLAKAMDPTGAGAASGGASASQLAQSPTLTLGATALGVILGTAAYMAPEQAKGLPVDKRADIWAFGVVLYEMLCGRRLFEAPTVPETLALVLTRPPDLAALPATTPPAIRRLVRRCLERDPRSRLHDIADARIVLAETQAGGDELVSPVVAGPPARRSIPLPVAGAAAIALVVAGYLVGQLGAPAPAARVGSSSPTFQKLTSRPGLETTPALSPDGKTLYFAAPHAERDDLDLWFTPVGGRKPIDLTADSSEDDSYPAVSPDGRLIAFRSERSDGGIFLMGATGESVRRLADGCFDPSWSPDGSRIACTTCPSGDPLARPCSGTLQVIEIASGARRKIATGDAAAPAWSSDGRRLAYWGIHEGKGQRDVWTVAVDGGEPVALTDDAAIDWNPVWSADGGSLAFLSDRGGAPGLWSIAIDATSGRPLGTPRSVVLPTEYADGVRRVGGRWVYVSRALRATIERRDFDPDRLALVGPARTVVEITGRMQSAALSPDGRSIAFSSFFPQQDLFVVGVDRGAPVQLTDDRAFDRFPIWDPNGERILFMSNRGGSYQIWAIRPDGSGLEQLTGGSEESGWVPLLSPDRTRLSTNHRRGLKVYDARGAAPWTAFERFGEPEVEKVPRFDGWSWSPDATRIAGFVNLTDQVLAGGGRRVAYYSLPDRKLRWFEAEGTGVAWSPDGRRLLVSNGKDGLRTLDTVTGAVRALAGGEAFAEVHASFSADLRTSILFRNQQEADIWLAEGIE